MSGSGQTELTSSGLATFDVSFPKRAAEEADGTTSPEELVAAAHSACFSMSLAGILERSGATPQTLDVTADVSVGFDENKKLNLTRILLTVRAEVDGIDEAGFQEAATCGRSVGDPRADEGQVVVRHGDRVGAAERVVETVVDQQIAIAREGRGAAGRALPVQARTPGGRLGRHGPSGIHPAGPESADLSRQVARLRHAHDTAGTAVNDEEGSLPRPERIEVSHR
jgi:osmotically inducible protein OsmC